MANSSTSPTYPPSESGYWEVKLSRGLEYANYFYSPGMSRIVVNEATLTVMLGEAELVTNVVAAD